MKVRHRRTRCRSAHEAIKYLLQLIDASATSSSRAQQLQVLVAEVAEGTVRQRRSQFREPR